MPEKSKITYMMMHSPKWMYSLDRVVYVMMVDTGKGILVTKCLFCRIHMAPERIASLIKNHGIIPTSIKVKKGNPWTVPLPRKPRAKANQYTKIVIEGLTTAQRGPKAAPLYVLMSSLFDSFKICFLNARFSFNIFNTT